MDYFRNLFSTFRFRDLLVILFQVEGSIFRFRSLGQRCKCFAANSRPFGHNLR